MINSCDRRYFMINEWDLRAFVISAWDLRYFVGLFDLILYVPSTIFQLYSGGSTWIEPVLS